MSAAATRLPWQGVALLEVGFAAFVGQAGDNRLHRHYAVQIAIAARHEVRLQREDGSESAGSVVGCPANVAHCLVPSPERVALLYLEPTSPLGRLAHRRFRVEPAVRVLRSEDLFADIEAAVTQSNPDAVLTIVRDRLLLEPNTTPTTADSRVRRVLDSAAFPEVPPSLTAAAALASLSPSRFSHLFAHEMGIAYRAFSKWRKLSMAVQAVARGADLTHAAHEAGFADSAHLSRTFVSMFGLAPSQAFDRLALAANRAS